MFCNTYFIPSLNWLEKIDINDVNDILTKWYFHFSRGGTFSQTFLALYALGVLFLAYDSYQMGLEAFAFLNLLCFAGAGVVMFKNK